MVPLPTLRQLRYLVAVAETGHFGRAADKCLVTQSTLSAGVQELETVLGTRLIERTKRRVMFTPLGEEMVVRARRVLAEAEDMVALAQTSEKPLSGLVRLGAIPTIGPYLLPKLLPSLRSAYPDLKLYIREEQTAPVLDQVRGGELDVALIALPYEVGDLEVFEIADDQLWLACPRDHALAAKAAVTPREIDWDGVLLLEDGHCLRDHALAACRSRVERRGAGAVQATSLFTLVELVAGGFGVTLVPDLAVKADVTRSADVVLKPLTEQTGRQLALVWRKTSARREEYHLLGQFLRTHVAALLA